MLVNPILCSTCRTWLPALLEVVDNVFDSMTMKEWADYCYRGDCAIRRF